MSIRISVVIATLNRASYLRKAIQSLVNQTLAHSVYEIIVVDNGSKDDTRKAVDEFSGVPNLMYFYEAVTGLSRARNTGWQNAHGESILFMDDDAVAASDCLQKYLQAVDTYGLQVGCIGGRVDLIWEVARPVWLHDEFLAILSEYRYSDRPCILGEEQFLSGCNFVVPRSVLQAIGGFREDLGRKGASLLASEDTYFRTKIDEKGLHAIYFPGALVKHHVSAYRLTKEWFRKHAYWSGRSDAIILREDGELLPITCRVFLSIKRVAWSIPRLFLMLVSFKTADRFRRQHQMLQSVGYISALWIR